MKIDIKKIEHEASDTQKNNLDLIESGNEIKYYNLNQGQYENHFYFGKKIQIGNKTTDLIVLDNGKTFVNYQALDKEKPNQIEEVGIHYNNPLLQLDNSWSREALIRYISVVSEGSVVYPEVASENGGKNTEKFEIQSELGQSGSDSKPSPSLPTPPILYTNYTNYTRTTLTTTLKKQLITDLQKTQQKYMDVPNKNAFTLTSCYIICTYLYTLFPAIGYLFFHSTSGSGKTKFAEIISFLSFNSVNATSPSESVLFRIIEQTKGLMLVDDFENLPDERKNVLNQILKVGYRRGGKTSRSEKLGKNWVPVFFDVYCPKIITNTIGLDLITLSRCIPIHLMKTKTNKGKIGVHPENKHWGILRDACYAFALTNWKEIEDTYWSLDVPELNNRDLELVKPMLAVAKIFGEDVFTELKTYLVELLQERDVVELSDSWEFILFDVIREEAKRVGGEFWLRVSTVLSGMRMRMDNSDETQSSSKPPARPSAHWIGGRLSTVPLFRKRRVGGGVEYLVSLKLVEEYMSSRGFLNKEEEVVDEAPKVTRQDIVLLDGDFCRSTCDFCDKQKELIGYWENDNKTQRKRICEPCYDGLLERLVKEK